MFKKRKKNGKRGEGGGKGTTPSTLKRPNGYRPLARSTGSSLAPLSGPVDVVKASSTSQFEPFIRPFYVFISIGFSLFFFLFILFDFIIFFLFVSQIGDH